MKGLKIPYLPIFLLALSENILNWSKKKNKKKYGKIENNFFVAGFG